MFIFFSKNMDIKYKREILICTQFENTYHEECICTNSVPVPLYIVWELTFSNYVIIWPFMYVQIASETICVYFRSFRTT